MSKPKSTGPVSEADSDCKPPIDVVAAEVVAAFEAFQFVLQEQAIERRAAEQRFNGARLALQSLLGRPVNVSEARQISQG